MIPDRHDDPADDPVENGQAAAPARGSRVLAAAAEALRLHTPSGWRVVRADLIALARSAHRPSAPVLGAHDLGEYLVSGDVLTAHLRAAVDRVPDAGTTAVSLLTGTTHRLEKVTVEVAALFGTHLPTLAVAVRAAVTGAMVEVLGALSPGTGAVHVHVHVGDVVVDVRELG